MLTSRLATSALQRLLQACAACQQQGVSSLGLQSSSAETSTSGRIEETSFRYSSTLHGPPLTRKQRERRLRNKANWLAADAYLPERPKSQKQKEAAVTAIPPLPALEEPQLWHRVGRITQQYSLQPQDVFAVAEIGGSQFKVTVDDVIYFPKLSGVDIDDVLSLNRILLAGSKDGTVIGRPLVPEAHVVAAVEEIFKDYKIFNFKLKRRKGYKRFLGHRDQLIALRILEVNVPGLMEAPEEQRVWVEAAAGGEQQQAQQQVPEAQQA
jgi:large subunit ribosomal protein L21